MNHIYLGVRFEEKIKPFWEDIYV